MHSSEQVFTAPALTAFTALSGSIFCVPAQSQRSSLSIAFIPVLPSGPAGPSPIRSANPNPNPARLPAAFVATINGF
jgi:hypothetical protein